MPICALASSVVDQPLATDVVAFGEVGLAGEVRRVTGLDRRLSEAARLGFRHALVPAGSLADTTVPQGIRAVEVSDVPRAIEAIGRLAGARTSGAHALGTV